MTAPAPITTSAPVTEASQVNDRSAALTRALSAPPAPVPPIAPSVRGRQVVDLARSPALVTAMSGAESARLPAWRSGGRVMSLVATAMVTVAMVCGLGWIGQSTSAGVPAETVPAETVVVRVGAGETLWDVARRVAPRSDQRAVVERIRHLNDVAGSALAPGQQLQVPNGQ